MNLVLRFMGNWLVGLVIAVPFGPVLSFAIGMFLYSFALIVSIAFGGYLPFPEIDLNRFICISILLWSVIFAGLSTFVGNE